MSPPPTPRRVDGFFYGLFMDAAILLQYGVTAVNSRHAYVDGFALRIGQRATLLPQASARAYGMLIALTHVDLDVLYGAPGLEAYRPEAVLGRQVDGPMVPALCYNLREAPLPGERNPEYALRLQGVLRGLGFPAAYVDAIS